MGKNSAEYMRAYRAKRKAERVQVNGWADRANARIAELEAELSETRRFAIESSVEISRLQEEVRHLKAELANHPPVTSGVGPRIRVHTPKTQQASRDAILRKINSRPK